MRQEFYKQNSRIKPDSAEFCVLELSTGRLVGFGGLFDMTRAMVATMFVGIGEANLRRKGFGTEASRLICEYGFFCAIFAASRWKFTSATTAARRVYEQLGFKIVGRLRGANLLTTVATTR